MGKLILISGGNGSGKSRYAEALVSKTEGPRYYIATMQPQTEENHSRIEKHIAQRRGLEFTTLELPAWVGKALIPQDSVVLLEDISNLLGNTLFSAGARAEDVRQDVLSLKKKCKLLFAVTIAGLSGERYAGETAAYIEKLNALNAWLLDQADAAVTMADGMPCWEKGGEDALF